MNAPLLFGWISLAIALVAAVFDWRKARIPNVLTLGALALAPFAHAAYVYHRTHAAHEALVAAGFSLLGAVVCGVVPLMLWRLRSIGGGDVKLIAAVGAIAGLSLGLEAIFYSFVFGTAFVVLRLAWQGTLLRSLASGLRLAVNPLLPPGRRFEARHELTEALRFGPAVCAGVAFAVYLHGGLS